MELSDIFNNIKIGTKEANLVSEYINNLKERDKANTNLYSLIKNIYTGLMGETTQENVDIAYNKIKNLNNKCEKYYENYGFDSSIEQLAIMVNETVDESQLIINVSKPRIKKINR
ncbi:MAG: hypothetical protein PHN56_01350 [Candidatus Nanoarchaeia archaeon]|nr:hypothetical protein [Candidatus Nanoarchaeia archaeon]